MAKKVRWHDNRRDGWMQQMDIILEAEKRRKLTGWMERPVIWLKR